jgi:DNA-binding NtrC family response regulator
MSQTKQRLIFVVDDEENILKALKRSLRSDAFEVMTIRRPADALAALKAHRPDVVLSDHLMAEMTGLEFLKVVRNRAPDTCRIMLTGHAEMEVAIEAINEGEIYRFLVKPWDDLDLQLALTMGLERLDLERENRRLASMVRVQQIMFEALEKEHPGASRVLRDARGAISLDEATP